MTERASVFEVTQIGLETTPGTAVAANRLLQATSLEPSVQADINPLLVRGGKMPTAMTLGREWATANIRGQAAYTDLTYMLASVMNKPTPVQQGTSAAYKWSFEIDQDAPDTIATYTVEAGSSVRAGRFSYGIVQEFGLSIATDAVEVSGSMLGQQYQDGVTLSASPTAVEVVPVLPSHFTVYADDSSGALGTTKLARVLKAEFKIADRFSPLWVLDASQDSWLAHVETQPTVTLSLLLEADAAGMGLLSTLRSGAKKFVRVQAVGPVADGTYNHTLTIDMSGMVSEVGEFADEDGVFALQWTLRAVYDSAWGKAVQVDIINKLSTL